MRSSKTAVGYEIHPIEFLDLLKSCNDQGLEPEAFGLSSNTVHHILARGYVVSHNGKCHISELGESAMRDAELPFEVRLMNAAQTLTRIHKNTIWKYKDTGMLYSVSSIAINPNDSSLFVVFTSMSGDFHPASMIRPIKQFFLEMYEFVGVPE